MRLVDLVAGVSRLADLGFGLPAGTSLRSSALAVVLAQSLDLPDEDVRAGLYTGLLLHVGCVGYAHATARLFGDEFTVQVAAERTNRADARDVATTLVPQVLRGRAPLDKVRLMVTAATRGQRERKAFDIAACEVGRDAARRLGLSEAVQVSVYHADEWWNGGGVPRALAGGDIPMGARLAAVSSVAALFDGIGGAEAAAAAVRGRAGGILDPGIAAHFADRAAELLGEVDATDPYDLVVEAEPRPVASVLDPALVEVAAVFGDLADLKSPYLHVVWLGWRAAAGSTSGSRAAASTSWSSLVCCMTSVGWRSRPRYRKSPAGSPPRSGSRYGCTPTTRSGSWPVRAGWPHRASLIWPHLGRVWGPLSRVATAVVR